MGYVIVPPQYIKGEGDNFHIFEANYNNIYNKIEIGDAPLCNDPKIIIIKKNINTNAGNFKKYMINIIMSKNNYRKTLDYYQNSNSIIFLNNCNQRDLKILCALLEINICGRCVSTIY